MTYHEYRMALAALAAEHRAKVADLDKRYADVDRTAVKAERARVAREARSAQALGKKAQRLLDDLAGDAWRAAWRGNTLTMQDANWLVVAHAVGLSEGRYTSIPDGRNTIITRTR